MGLSFVGFGKTHFKINGIVRIVIGIIILLGGIVISIVKGEILFLVLGVAIGVIAMLNGWYYLRRAEKF